MHHYIFIQQEHGERSVFRNMPLSDFCTTMINDPSLLTEEFALVAVSTLLQKPLTMLCVEGENKIDFEINPLDMRDDIFDTRILQELKRHEGSIYILQDRAHYSAINFHKNLSNIAIDWTFNGRLILEHSYSSEESFNISINKSGSNKKGDSLKIDFFTYCIYDKF